MASVHWDPLGTFGVSSSALPFDCEGGTTYLAIICNEYNYLQCYIYISNSSTQLQIFPSQTLSFAVSFRGVSLLIVFVVGFLAIVTYATVALPSWSSDRCPNLPGSALKSTQDMRRMEKDGKCDTQVSYAYLMRTVSYAYHKSHMGADVQCAFKRFSRFPMNLHESSCIVNG